MSKGFITSILFLFVFVLNATAQVNQPEESMTSKEFRPSIGLGMGMLNYFGDVNSNENHGAFHNQFGYTIHVSRKINSSMDLGFSFLTGTIIGNERSIERNLNFKTNIYSGSVYISYNFDHFLPERSMLHPYVTLGFESFEYNNKSDLVDANGNKYFYWTDGTIRSIDQQSAFASQAVLMKRDYVYETDLRAANLDGLGKYPQISIGVPVGLGFNLNVSERVNFKIGSTFHFTFTDLIDNVSDEGVGVRQGSAAPDFFIFNSVSLHYDLLNSPKRVNLEDFDFPDFFVLDMVDEDRDGVVDGLDVCPFTPEGVAVDENGCPLDDDSDGVPNYLDKELASVDTSFVNKDGIALTEEDFYNQYLKYIDSLDVPEEVLYRIAGKPKKSATYRILLGEFSGRLPEDLAKDFLNEGDVFGALTESGKTAYLAGKYSELEDAEKRKKELLEKGMPQATIVVWEGNHFVTLKRWEEDAKKEEEELYKKELEKKEDLNGMYAVKLGSTPADASVIDKIEFFEYEDVVVLEGDKNGSDYVVGPFIDSVGASQILQEVDRSKFPNASIVKISNGKTLDSGIKSNSIPASLDPKGATAWNRPKSNKEKRSEKLLSKLEDAFVIDFGSTKNPKTKSLIEKIKKKTNVVEVVDPNNGNTRLITEDRKSLEVAKKEVSDLKKEGIVTATVAQVKGGKIVTVKPSSIATSNKDEVLSKLENSYVIDFGSTKDSKTKAIINKIKEKVDVIEVVDPIDGETKLITKDAKTLAVAEKEVKRLVKEGVTTAKVAKVKNGKIIPIKPSGINANSNDEVLTKLENSYVIDFGSTKDPKTKAIINKIKEKVEVVEVVDPADGNTKLITKDAKTLAVAEKEVKELMQEGVTTAKVAKVKNGAIIPVKESSIISASQEELTKIENEFVVKLGTIDKQTSASDRKKLLDVPNTIKIKNVDGSIDVISKSGHKQEQLAHVDKASYHRKGFVDSKVAYVRDGKVEVLKKEALDGKYTLSLGSFKSNVPNKQVNEIASISDVESMETFNPDVTTYTVGNFDDPVQAKNRLEELLAQGFTPELVKYEDGKIKSVDISTVFDPMTIQKFKELESLNGLMKTGGVVFRVQLGAYRGKINETVFKGVKTLAFPSAGGITKYVTGSFGTYQQSYVHKLEMKKLGFTGAFVVAYKDGRRISVTDLVNQEKYKQVKESISPIEKQLHKVDKVVDNKSVKTTAQSNKGKNNVSYRVQIGAFKDDAVQEKLADFDNVTMEVYGKYKRYVSGSFSSYKEASQHKELIKQKGFTGAFVVAYNGEDRVAAPGENPNVIKQTDLSDAEKSIKSANSKDKNKLMILIQVGLYRGAIPTDLKELFNTLPSVTKQVTPHGVVRYMTGNFKNPSEAAAYKEDLIKQGFEGAFLVAYYDNERIKIQEAIAIFQGK